MSGPKARLFLTPVDGRHARATVCTHFCDVGLRGCCALLVTEATIVADPTLVIRQWRAPRVASGMPMTGDLAGPLPNVQRGDTGTTTVSAPPLHLRIFSVGLKRAKWALTAVKVIESLVVPPYPESSNSGARGMLIMEPVASVEEGVNAKAFIAYRTPNGISRKYSCSLSPHVGFCLYDWVEYPCSGIELCPNVPNKVLDWSHTALKPSSGDEYAVYELFLGRQWGVRRPRPPLPRGDQILPSLRS